MRALKQIPLLLASLALPAAALRAAPGPADVAAARTYVERDQAYAPAARTEALRRVAALPRLTRAPARFELEVAAIAALAGNGHSALLPPQWPSRYRRSPVHFGLFADGLYVVSAPPDRARLVGRRVLRINGHNWRDIRTAYARYQGGLQSFRDQFVTLFMELPALLVAAGFGSDPARLTLTLGARGRRPETVIVPAALAPYGGEAAFVGQSTLIDGAAMLPVERVPLYLREPDRIYRLAFPEGIDGAWVQLKAVRGLGIAPIPRQQPGGAPPPPSAQYRRRSALQQSVAISTSRATFMRALAGDRAGPGLCDHLGPHLLRRHFQPRLPQTGGG